MRNWVVDKAHSTVGFEVKHLMISKVRGQFDSFTAHVEAEDLSDLTTANIEFSFDADSINTRNDERDRHLKSAEFFDIRNFPTIDFQSTHITETSDGNHYKVTGDLTIKDITHPVTFDVIFGGSAADLSGAKVYGFQAETTLNREQFGLTWNAALETGGILIGNDVSIYVHLELIEAAAEAAEDFMSSAREKQSSSGHHAAYEILTDEIHQMIAENLTDLVAVLDRSGMIHYATPSFKTILDYDLSKLKKSDFFALIHPDEIKNVKSELISCSDHKLRNAIKSEFRLLHANGSYVDVEASIIHMNKHSANYRKDLILVVMQDINERKEVEKAIYQLAFHDSLTNLPNRRSFMNHLRSEVMDRIYSKSKLAIFFIDLDNFKTVNDRWGHDAGDLVLQEAAERIRSAIRPKDIAARFGGDEYVVMLKDVQGEEDAVSTAKKILLTFQQPINNEFGQDYILTPSIGVALYPDHGESPEELIKNADTALYYVKERGKNNYMVFDQVMEHQSLERRILENALRQGIEDEQFYIEYQPKMNMTTNELIGMEALVRWKHPELGVIPPGKFIPLAEETGLIIPLGEWILRESCRQTVEWINKNYPPLNLSVNVSVRQLEDLQFVEKVKVILQETGLDP